MKKKHIGKKEMSRWDNNINNRASKRKGYLLMGLILLGIWQLGEFAMMGSLALFDFLGR